MKLYTIGFTKKSAEQFFGTLQAQHIPILLDIRLNNKSQLAGFAKGEDLSFFLPRLCGCAYRYGPEYAPDKDLLSGYRKEQIPWEEYEQRYTALMKKRGVCKGFFHDFGGYEAVCLLCSEPTPEHCHRRLLAEMLAEYGADSGVSVEIIHL